MSGNAVNQNERHRLTKRAQNENGEGKRNDALPAKRAALGNLSSNIRVQPHRAAKASSSCLRGSNDENALPKTIKSSKSSFNVSCAPAFSVHVDPEPSQSSKPIFVGVKRGSSSSVLSENLDLDSAVTSLSRRPLAEVFLPPRVFNELKDSPMILDSSDEEEEPDIPEPVKDIDENADIVINVPEYAAEIHEYLKKAELNHRAKAGYMKKQPDINNSMRAILVDWLVEVAEEYRLSSETLYLAVNYIDRFLSSMVVLRKKLQLVGTACMLIASKLEEIYPPEVSEFVYITDDTYTDKEVRKMENMVLKVLSFDLSVPTVLSFLDRYEKAADVPANLSKKFSFLTRYLCELTLQDADPHLKYLPSTLAASSVVLALHTLDLPSWSSSLEHYTGFQQAGLNDCISDLHRTFSMAPNNAQKAIREKYSESRFMGVATIPPPSTIPIS